ncbi:putative competence-damage inducible protein [Marinithermofilum abyssi]|uniref:Putative competence-damage inducible protein n=1 Tax=Marinithermofilum abyssi TaxID=1571185 RepID=A0A8J2YAZ4_9BACL|nr:competence/damage-inducible protein A [Marinithermofilum abyssi]GGE24863.1 putative competence-damage inducible protein [Marinithermofilum abyssi]
MRAELIAVGTELLLGQIVDTHSAYLSQELSRLGIDVYYHSTVGDNRGRLQEVIRLAKSRSDIVIFTGGLGPTEDDLTKEALAEVLGVSLIEHAPSLEHIRGFFKARGLTMPEANRKQAMVFPGGVVFPNPNGTAPGVAVTHDQVTYVLLPGPPVELIPMFEDHVRSFLHGLLPHDEVVVSRVLRFYGIGESHLEEKVGHILRQQSNPTIAPLAKEGEVTLRLTAKAASEAEAQALIQPVRQALLEVVGKYCYSDNDEPLERICIRRLTEQQRTVALAESCSGGLLAETLTSIPGSSQAVKGGIVSYSNEAKERLLQVPASVLERFGAVSMEAALHMAEGARAALNTDFALSITGVAGPEPAEEKPVGLVYVGLAEKGQPSRAYRLQLSGSRRKIQIRSVKHAMFILQERLKKGETT